MTVWAFKTFQCAKSLYSQDLRVAKATDGNPTHSFPPPSVVKTIMVHLRSQLKMQEREKRREQKREGWHFIHNTRVEGDKTVNNSWQDKIIGETVSIVTPEIVIEYLNQKFPCEVLPSVRQYFREDVPKGLVIQAQYVIGT